MTAARPHPRAGGGHRRGRPSPRALFLVLLWANALPVIASTSAAPTLPILARVFADRPDVGRLVPLVITLGPLAVALSGPVVGYLLDRFGRRPVLVAGAVLYGVGGAAPVLMDDLGQVVATRAVVGVAVCCLMTGATTVISDQFSGTTRARVLSRQAGIVGVVATLFILLSGLLAEGGWRAPFLVFLVGLPLVPLLLAVIPEPDRPGTVDVTAADPPAVPEVLPALQAPSLPLTLLVPALYLGMLGLQATNFLAVVQLPFLLEERFASGPSLVGAVVALATLAYAIGALLSVRLAVRFEPRAAVAVAALAIGIAYLGIARGSLPVVVVANLLGGLGFGLVVPNLIAWLAAVAPAAYRGRLFGGLTASLFLGQFLSSPLWAPLVAASGRDGAIAVAGRVWIGAALALLVWRAGRPARRPAPEAEVRSC